MNRANGMGTALGFRSRPLGGLAFKGANGARIVRKDRGRHSATMGAAGISEQQVRLVRAACLHGCTM